jgi:hypothetical protein
MCHFSEIIGKMLHKNKCSGGCYEYYKKNSEKCFAVFSGKKISDTSTNEKNAYPE